MNTSSKFVLTSGMVIRGKWNKRSYRIERLLGEGANGKVFLVRSSGQVYALKVGSDTIDIQTEINVLRELDARRQKRFLYDADDVEWNGVVYPFYVMTYISGKPPQQYMKQKGSDWFYVIGLSLLEKLGRLHRHGYAFGDLKGDNVLVSGYGEVELVDYGGVTAIGKGIKQFTELYDRGYWNAGERVADNGYDLFGFAVLCLQMGGSRQELERMAKGLPQNRCPEELLRLVDATPLCKPVAPVLKKAIAGGWSDAFEAAEAWRSGIEGGYQTRQRLPERASAWITGVFVASVGLLVSMVCVLLWNGS